MPNSKIAHAEYILEQGLENQTVSAKNQDVCATMAPAVQNLATWCMAFGIISGVAAGAYLCHLLAQGSAGASLPTEMIICSIVGAVIGAAIGLTFAGLINIMAQKTSLN